MKIEVRPEPFDPWDELREYQQHGGLAAGSYGATALFVGTMRDLNEGNSVHAMTLEHYPGMTERHLQRICAEAAARWAIVDVLLLHRVGDLRPADPIVLVAVWSVHRKEAFDACRYIMEDLKSKASLWKKEQLDSASRWVQKNTPGQ